MSRYDYAELREAAIKFNATTEEVNALGEWFERYGRDSWNGEYFDADDGYRLFPVYKEVDEDEFELVGYEFK